MKFHRHIVALVIACASPSFAGTLAQFRTVLGDLDVELYDQDKPVTVRNFIRYVQSDAYEKMFLHRCVPGFVIQGGGFAVTNRASTNDAVSFLNVTNFGTITNEFTVGLRLSNVYGTVAMAKIGGDPNSASSQWFFNLGDNSTNLDNQNGGFTVFGRVVAGTNVLNSINALAKGSGIVDLRWWFGDQAATFSDLPVNYDGVTYPRYDNLIYADISLLGVRVRFLTDRATEVSWNSVSNRTQHLEFTTNSPPVWWVLSSTNGTGSTVTVVDSNATNLFRFYRVRVDY